MIKGTDKVFKAKVVNGKAVFGADAVDYSQFWADFIHYTEALKMALDTGGDDPTLRVAHGGHRDRNPHAAAVAAAPLHVR